MIGTILKRLLLMFFFLILQILIFNHVQILGYATPMICVYFILLLPLGTARWEMLLWAFVMGLCQDIFSNTPGMNAASLTLVALIQPWVQKSVSTRDLDDDEESLPPSAKNMDWPPFIRYVSICVVIQQVLFYILESFSFFNIEDMGINIAGGSLMSVLIIIAIEGVRMGGSSKNR